MLTDSACNSVLSKCPSVTKSGSGLEVLATTRVPYFSAFASRTSKPFCSVLLSDASSGINNRPSRSCSRISIGASINLCVSISSNHGLSGLCKNFAQSSDPLPSSPMSNNGAFIKETCSKR